METRSSGEILPVQFFSIQIYVFPDGSQVTQSAD